MGEFDNNETEILIVSLSIAKTERMPINSMCGRALWWGSELYDGWVAPPQLRNTACRWLASYTGLGIQSYLFLLPLILSDFLKKKTCEVQAFLKAIQFYRQDKGKYEAWEMLRGSDVRVCFHLCFYFLFPSLFLHLPFSPALVSFCIVRLSL